MQLMPRPHFHRFPHTRAHFRPAGGRRSVQCCLSARKFLLYSGVPLIRARPALLTAYELSSPNRSGQRLLSVCLGTAWGQELAANTGRFDQTQLYGCRGRTRRRPRCAATQRRAPTQTSSIGGRTPSIETMNTQCLISNSACALSPLFPSWHDMHADDANTAP